MGNGADQWYKRCYSMHIITSKDGELMEQVLKEMLSQSNQFKVLIINRKDSLFTTEKDCL